MASLKEVKTRINSVKSTRKITSAMKMVASAKLHKAQASIAGMLPYQQKLDQILSNFLSGDVTVESPYVARKETKRVAIVTFSSNSSLCGAYNANVIKLLTQVVEEFRSLGEANLLFFPVGNKVADAVKHLGFQPQDTFATLADKPSYKEAAALGQRLMKLYAEGEVDRVVLIYHHFKSMGSQTLLRETYLPVDLSQVTKKNDTREPGDEKPKDAYRSDYIVEPSPEQLVADLIPTVLCQRLFTAAVDSNASEHAARTMAMQVATDNANDLIQDLTKQYNKTRQQAITSELLDIVGGSMK
ncbi:MAG: F0F1 ATP synthase subunit gamma [Mediterranea sp.]|jgi:F-type H+-transporting ATPase subunit gamma|nr:F0F1 ATP synthase subunit gamma [Mediterranea sp.]